MVNKIGNEELAKSVLEPGSSLTLSPIIEMNESIMDDSLGILGDEHEETLQSTYNSSNTNCSLGLHQQHSIFQKPTSSPHLFEINPEILGKIHSELLEENEYLKKELEELREFTKLEKQITHENCVPIDEVNKRNEASSNLKKIIETLKNNEILFKQHVSQIAEMIKEHLQKGVRDTQVKDQLLFLTNCGEELDIIENQEQVKLFSSCDSIKKLVQYLFMERYKLENELSNLQLTNKKTKDDNLCLTKKIESLEKLLTNSQKEMQNLTCTIDKTNIKENSMKSYIITLESKFKKIDKLMDEKKYFIENYNIRDHDVTQQEFSLIFNDIKMFVENMSGRSFKLLSVQLKDNEELFSCFKRLLNSKNQQCVCDILQSLEKVFNIDSELTVQINKLKSRVQKCDSKIKKLRDKIECVESQLSDDICKRTKSLQNNLCSLLDENKILNEEIAHKEKKIIELNCDLTAINCSINEHFKLDNETEFGIETLLSNVKALALRYNTLRSAHISMFQWLEIIIDSCDINEGLKGILDRSREWGVASFETLFDSEIQHIYNDLVDKLKLKLNLYDKYKHESSIMQDILISVENPENKIKLSINLQEMNNTVESESVCRLTPESKLCYSKDLGEVSHEVESPFHIFKQKLEAEKSLLKEFLIDPQLKCLNDVYDKFDLLKDITEITVSRIIELQRQQESSKSEFQYIIDSVSKDLNDFKSDLYQLKDLFPINENSECNRITTDSPTSDNLMSLKKELNYVGVESLNIISYAKQLQQDIISGQSVINRLKDQCSNVIKDISINNTEITELQKVIATEQRIKLEQNLELDRINKQLQQTSKKNAKLQEVNKTLNTQLLEMSVRSENLLSEAMESVTFYSHQCYLMTCYITSIESLVIQLKQQKDHSEIECTTVRNELVNMQTSLNEANTILLNIISILPFKPSTPMHAVSLVQQLLNELMSVRASECKLLQKLYKMEKIVESQVGEIKSLITLNNNFKNEQKSLEDNVRTLRADLRKLRSQIHKQGGSSEVAIQTDAVCCSSFKKEIGSLKNALSERNNTILQLGEQIKTSCWPCRESTHNLEAAALVQAKERIKELNIKLLHQENLYKELQDRLKPVLNDCQETK